MDKEKAEELYNSMLQTAKLADKHDPVLASEMRKKAEDFITEERRLQDQLAKIGK